MRDLDVIRHGHYSSKFNRSYNSLVSAVLWLSALTDLMTWTEVEFERREKALRLSGWGALTGDISNRDDCAIMWLLLRWHLVNGWGANVTTLKNRIPGGFAPPTAARFAVLDHLPTGKRFLVTVCHLPSGVEADLSSMSRARILRMRASRARVWLSAHRGWKKQRNAAIKRYGCDGLIVCGDFNVNIKRAVIRSLLRAIQPGMRLVWGTKFPAAGTYGKRIIDFTSIRGDLAPDGSPKILAPRLASDHRAYVERLRITRLSRIRQSSTPNPGAERHEQQEEA